MGTCLSSGDQISHYRIEELLNDGAYALAYRATDLTDIARQPVFLKQYKSPSVRSGWYRGYIDYEAEIRRRIEENGLTGKTCRFLDFFESRDAGQKGYYQVFEFITQGRDLAEQLREPAFRWQQRLTFAKLMLSTLARLHDAEIVHCDLKPENLYLVEDARIAVGYQLKVIDFDHSLLADVEAPWVGYESYAGTPGYLSPEHLRGECPTKASDVFTSGLILHELLCQGGHPYAVADPELYVEEALGFRAPLPQLLQTTGDSARDQSFSELIRVCLDPVAANRPTIRELHQAFLQMPRSAPAAAPPTPAATTPTVPLAVRKVPSPAASFRKLEATPEGPLVDPSRDVSETPVAPVPLRRRPGVTPPPMPRAVAAPPPVLPTSTPAPPPEPAPEAPSEAENSLPTLTLVGPDGMTNAVLHIETRVGKRFLARFGADARYYSELQYTLWPEEGCWHVNPNPTAQNQTILNGAALERQTILQDGDVLCVGNLRHGVTKLPLKILLS